MVSFWLIMATMIQQYPDSVKSISDDSVVVDSTCFEEARLSIEYDIERSFASIEQIVLLPPLIVEPTWVDSTEYPYSSVDYAVQNVRPHLRMDSKSRSNILIC